MVDKRKVTNCLVSGISKPSYITDPSGGGGGGGVSLTIVHGAVIAGRSILPDVSCRRPY